jgi:hypothetical protein
MQNVENQLHSSCFTLDLIGNSASRHSLYATYIPAAGWGKGDKMVGVLHFFPHAGRNAKFSRGKRSFIPWMMFQYSIRYAA